MSRGTEAADACMGSGGHQGGGNNHEGCHHRPMIRSGDCIIDCPRKTLRLQQRFVNSVRRDDVIDLVGARFCVSGTGVNPGGVVHLLGQRVGEVISLAEEFLKQFEGMRASMRAEICRPADLFFIR
eukprot:612935-Amphidinium_carterae.7